MRPGTRIKGFWNILNHILVLLSQTVTILRNHNMLFVNPVCSLLRDTRKLKPRTVKPNADRLDLLERSGYLSSSHSRPFKPLNKPEAFPSLP